MIIKRSFIAFIATGVKAEVCVINCPLIKANASVKVKIGEINIKNSNVTLNKFL